MPASAWPTGVPSGEHVPHPENRGLECNKTFPHFSKMTNLF